MEDYAQINGAKIYYEIKGSGFPLVFIHGFSFDTRMWDDQVEFFSKNYRVIRYDMRGFGKSSLPSPKTYSHVDDLRALLNYLNIKTAHIIGLSRGGRWALQFALEYSGYVKSLTLVDARPNGFSNFIELPLSSIAKKEGIHKAKEAWFNSALFTYARKFKTLAKRLWIMISDYSGWHWYNIDTTKKYLPVTVEELHKLKLPTLIIVGELDREDFIEAAYFMQQEIELSRLLIIEGVGHMSNMEDPITFNNKVLEFLNLHTPGEKA